MSNWKTTNPDEEYPGPEVVRLLARIERLEAVLRSIRQNTGTPEWIRTQIGASLAKEKPDE